MPVALQPGKQAVGARHDEQRQNRGHGDAADDRQRHRHAGFGARADAQSGGNGAGDRRDPRFFSRASEDAWEARLRIQRDF